MSHYILPITTKKSKKCCFVVLFSVVLLLRAKILTFLQLQEVYSVTYQTMRNCENKFNFLLRFGTKSTLFKLQLKMYLRPRCFCSRATVSYMRPSNFEISFENQLNCIHNIQLICQYRIDSTSPLEKNTVRWDKLVDGKNLSTAKTCQIVCVAKLFAL